MSVYLEMILGLLRVGGFKDLLTSSNFMVRVMNCDYLGQFHFSTFPSLSSSSVMLDKKSFKCCLSFLHAFSAFVEFVLLI